MIISWIIIEACNLTKSQITPLDFVLNRFFVKLFYTTSITVITECQTYFSFKLPSTWSTLLAEGVKKLKDDYELGHFGYYRVLSLQRLYNVCCIIINSLLFNLSITTDWWNKDLKTICKCTNIVFVYCINTPFNRFIRALCVLIRWYTPPFGGVYTVLAQETIYRALLPSYGMDRYAPTSSDE